ncbi:hypothetical protein B7494_g3183 [Chlorociboria aeruginascens]|nr:hypothetical protein B7494_g3183 [Chlorociboria aeruginascens]
MATLPTSLQSQHPSLMALYLFSATYILYRFVTGTITFVRRRAIIIQNGCQPVPRYPHKEPFFGLDIFFENLRLLKSGTFLLAVQRRFNMVNGGRGANTYSAKVLGETMIFTNEPENVKTILATKFREFELPPIRIKAFGAIFGRGIFTTNGHDWETSRALLRPNFARKQIADLDIFESHFSKMKAHIPLDGSTVDLQKLFFMLTLDSATEFLFGHSTNVLAPGGSVAGERFSEAFEYACKRAGDAGRAGMLAVLMPDQRNKTEIGFIHEYVKQYVDKAIRIGKGQNIVDGSNGRYTFLEELAKTGYDAKRIQDELLNILLAGRDTTAGLLSHVFYYLARRQDVFQKLRAEVVDLKGARPTFGDIKEMKYLRYCLSEIIPLGGGPDGKCPVFVKKGQRVGYSVYAIHRRKDFYGEDAEYFRPERWETIRPGWENLPFNGGPRICIGQQFALTEASYTIIRLLQSFEAIESRDDSEYREAFVVTLAIRGGTKVAMTPASAI